MSLTTPVALLIYNRPHLTQRVFAEIAKARPQTLFVVADGARSDHPDDVARIAATRRIIDSVDWPCEVLKNYSQVNMGCKHRISTGLEWIFGTVEDAIILEDDCLPDPTFFRFGHELLDYYRYDERVVSISGSNYQHGQSRTAHGYYFSKYFHCSGWASWRRVWKHFDPDMKSWPNFQAAGGLQDLADNWWEADYWTRMFNSAFEGTLDSWACPWFFACWAQRGLTVIPNVNLISNIGYGDGATHTQKANQKVANLPTRSIDDINHPPFVVRNREADFYTFQNNYQHLNGLRKIRRRLRRVFDLKIRKTAA